MSEKATVARIFQTVRPYRGLLAVSMVCMAMVAAFSAAQAYLCKPLIDKIFIEKDQATLNILPLVLIGVFLAKGIFYYGYKVLLEKVGQSVIRDLRERVFAHLHAMPIAFFYQTPTGELISRVVSDIALIQNAVSQAMVGIVKDLLQSLGLLGVIFYMNWKLASFSFIFLPLALIPITVFGRLHRRNSHLAQQTMAGISSILHETIAGNRIVKAFCMERYEMNRFAKVVRSLLAVRIKDTGYSSLSHSLMELMGGIFVAFIIWYGGREVLQGVSTPGTFIAFLASLVMFYEPIKSISRVNSTVQQGIAAASRVFQILDRKPEITDRPGAGSTPQLSKQIEFREVSFSYDGKVKALNGINLTINKGEALAIVGSSGSGKTTLANLIPRFFDVSSGQILLDGTDIREVTMKSLRGQIAIVSQQTILFNDSVRNNIAYGDPDRGQDEIRGAAQAAHALDFIEKMGEGFDTVIGEAGAKLSGGQQQRLSIARALLKNAPILILDEATSALDSESEREVQKALENLMKNRTTFVIAHRLSTTRNCDRIIVLQNGQIIEQGTHDQLLSARGVYESLYTTQLS
ncbi:MAG: lipid A export permease/ATP-binding protein MsbA [Proteobacteria bacterium]|nr:lipid A export permease/ATP-binding protein MsbA [Pseudomonadota bacterium]MBU1687262.1 lipid A export permease/ATP-binding protein MsbA [Pseudomonadota bacterium]